MDESMSGSCRLLDGKKLSVKILSELRDRIQAEGLKMKLVVVLVGDNPASQLYVSKKGEMCEKAGVDFEIIKFDESISEGVLEKNIEELNKDEGVTGILLQLPLPRHIDPRRMLDSILPEKDVDGLTSFNLGKTLARKEDLVPATPQGIIRLLEEYDIEVKGKNIVIINDSILVGMPLAAMLLNRRSTVSVCNKSTKNLEEHTKRADILVVAVGKPGLITADMVKENAVIIDVGICRVGNKVCGDVDFEGVKQKAAFLTPVPGGVGPMTVIMVLENLVALKIGK
jgi:methylenetetrahydrofolate dehydrogenase (NADP+)/methenyltetrahydrofolate cyclohydrolase